MGARVIAVVSRDNLELTEKDMIAFAHERIKEEDRKIGMEIDVLELTSFMIRDCDTISYEIAGRSIRNEYTSPESVKEIYAALKKFDPYKDLSIYEDLSCSPEDMEEMIKFLKVCSERSLGLYNPPFDLF